MDIVAGLITALNLGIVLVVALRLLRRSDFSLGAPELWLGFYFLLSSFLGMGLSCFVYASLAYPSISLPYGVLWACHAGFLIFWSAGNACIYVFTWCVFRPDSRWARLLARGGIAVMLGGLVGVAITESFKPRDVNGLWYWISFSARTGVMLWLAIESFRYWGLMRRRLRLGLADPVLTNRFLLWGVWAGTVFLMGQADPVARVWYALKVGTSTGGPMNPEMARPIVAALVSATSILGIIVALMLLLTFFPTAGYRRWLEGRHAARLRDVSGVA